MITKWRVDPPANDGIVARIILDEDDHVIATVNHGANAPLIARAPQMDERIKELRDALKEVYIVLMRAGRDSWTIRNIREVLSKED